MSTDYPTTAAMATYADTINAAHLISDPQPLIETIWDLSMILIGSIGALGANDRETARRLALTAAIDRATYQRTHPAPPAGTFAACEVTHNELYILTDQDINTACDRGDLAPVLCHTGAAWAIVLLLARHADDIPTLARLAYTLLAEVSTYGPAQVKPVIPVTF
ncbi:hypothetical protein HNP84_002591 [Thermocatellispora tengchongensis]|uniref:Uncharacterized protein n=1 Tax=Thermocatellispora tengchongensis TaxID=1073253 RepID=A0A840P5X1_9ACTN|nr:hypothetical protein [Thermocatellispora tengchongensis]MBB5132870.1 hypothetical protein [Thermocatellispora tengchongensis]